MTAARRDGWWIVAGLFLVLTVSSGFGFYNFSVYISVLAAARDFTVAEVSVAVSLFFVVGGVAGMVVARLIDRFDVRWIMVCGALLGGIALAGAGRATQLWQLYCLFAVFGIGNSAVSLIPATTLITRWFPGRNRSVALSIASTGLSMGGVAVTPVSAWLLRVLGVETSLTWFGAAFFVLVVPVALGIVRAAPPATDTSTPRPSDGRDWTYAEAVRSRFFVLVTTGYVLCMGAQVGGISHLYSRAVQIADVTVAAGTVQALTIMSITGRFFGGWVVTRVPLRSFMLINVTGQALGLSVLAQAQAPWQLLLGAGLFGATVGNLLMLQPLWLADAFGERAYPRAFALSNALSVIGVAAGPTLLGVLFEGFGYGIAYFGAVSVSLAAGITLFSAGAAPRRTIAKELV
ncbi:MAG: MFS transporter [Pseudomonadales bacterium]